MGSLEKGRNCNDIHNTPERRGSRSPDGGSRQGNLPSGSGGQGRGQAAASRPDRPSRRVVATIGLGRPVAVQDPPDGCRGVTGSWSCRPVLSCVSAAGLLARNLPAVRTWRYRGREDEVSRETRYFNLIPLVPSVGEILPPGSLRSPSFSAEAKTSLAIVLVLAVFSQFVAAIIILTGLTIYLKTRPRFEGFTYWRVGFLACGITCWIWCGFVLVACLLGLEELHGGAKKLVGLAFTGFGVFAIGTQLTRR